VFVPMIWASGWSIERRARWNVKMARGIERRVVAMLRVEWRNLLRCTTIDQAMGHLGIPFSHAERLRVAEILKRRSHGLPGMRWSLPTYVLTNSERLVARFLLCSWRRAGEIPPPPAAAKQLKLAAKTAEDAYDALRWLGFLASDERGWQLVDDLGPFLSGLGFHFHEIVLPERGERFNTNCALDFFIMTHRPTREQFLARTRLGTLSETYGEGMSDKMVRAIRELAATGAPSIAGGTFYERERAVLNDACGWSDTPIRIVMERGELVEVVPASTWYLRGGG
jgi:hypothetical protein